MKRVNLDPVEIVSLYDDGMRPEDIATLADCSRSPIYRILRDPDINPGGIRQRRMDFDEAELVRLYQTGMTGRKALDAVGAPTSRGWDVLRDPAKNPLGLRHEASVATRFKARLGKYKSSEGYVMQYVSKDHEFYDMANKSSGIPEHRLVMAQSLGRPLRNNENVHHINGIRDDNRIENLELWNKSQPSGIRNSDKHCLTCACGEGAA